MKMAFFQLKIYKWKGQAFLAENGVWIYHTHHTYSTMHVQQPNRKMRTHQRAHIFVQLSLDSVVFYCFEFNSFHSHNVQAYNPNPYHNSNHDQLMPNFNLNLTLVPTITLILTRKSEITFCCIIACLWSR